MPIGSRALRFSLVVIACVTLGVAQAQQLPAPHQASSLNPADAHGSEWLIAQLLADGKYQLEDLDRLTDLVEAMPPAQRQELIAAYERRESATARREAYQAWRQYSLARVQAVHDQRLADIDRFRQERNAAAEHAQARLERLASESRDVSARWAMRPSLMSWPGGGWFGIGFGF